MTHVHATDDGWRPGFPRRAPNYEKTKALGRSWRWSPGETSGRVLYAILEGTPHLSDAQNRMLMLYAGHLNDEDLEQSIAKVYPSASFISDRMGKSASACREIRAQLEHAGYLVRVMTRANRPAVPEAFDLSPLMARLAEMDAALNACRDRQTDRREVRTEPEERCVEVGARAPESRRLEQSQENLGYPVRGASAARSSPASAAMRPRQAGAPPAPGSCPDRRDRSASDDHDPPAQRTDGQPAGSGGEVRAPTNRLSSRQAAARCSPGRASGAAGAQAGRPVPAETVRQELTAAAQLCPRLAELVTDQLLANPLRRDPDDLVAVMAAAAELLPDPTRNPQITARWGWENHGGRVIAMLALAVEDPALRSPSGAFGDMASKKGVYADLRLNFHRALKSRGRTDAQPEPATPAAPGPGEKIWAAIDGRLRHVLKRGEYGAWFSQVECRGLEDGVLYLAAPTPAAAEIRLKFGDRLKAAARDVGLHVDQLVITSRKSSG